MLTHAVPSQNEEGLTNTILTWRVRHIQYKRYALLIFSLFLLLTDGLHVILLYIFNLLLKLHRLHCASQFSTCFSASPAIGEETKTVLKQLKR